MKSLKKFKRLDLSKIKDRKAVKSSKKLFCEIISNSQFCLGSKDWTIDLTWAILSSDRVAKILEGGFSGGNHPPKPPACNVSEFESAWDDVIRRMLHHHGKPAIRSWFSKTVITNVTAGVITLECPSQFICGWIETHYLADLLDHLADHQPPITTINLTVKED